MKNSCEHLFADFDLEKRRSIYLIGGGGKTSLMFALAHCLKDRGCRVLTTTTTKILVPDRDQTEEVLLMGTAPDFSKFKDRLRTALETHGHVTAASEILETVPSKLGGLTVPQVETLVAAGVASTVLVEADGSAGRSLKAHEGHEPVVSSKADLVVVVIGVDCLDQPLSEDTVHRAELLSKRTGLQLGMRIQPKDVAATLFHPEGYLKTVGAASDVLIFISKAGTTEARQKAQKLATVLKENDRAKRISRIVIGELKA